MSKPKTYWVKSLFIVALFFLMTNMPFAQQSTSEPDLQAHLSTLAREFKKVDFGSKFNKNRDKLYVKHTKMSGLNYPVCGSS